MRDTRSDRRGDLGNRADQIRLLDLLCGDLRRGNLLCGCTLLFLFGFPFLTRHFEQRLQPRDRRLRHLDRDVCVAARGGQMPQVCLAIFNVHRKPMLGIRMRAE